MGVVVRITAAADLAPVRTRLTQPLTLSRSLQRHCLVSTLAVGA